MFTGTVRQPESGQLGALSETAVKHAFIRLGWGAAEAQSFDVGTDLLLLVRDERLFDARLVRPSVLLDLVKPTEPLAAPSLHEAVRVPTGRPSSAFNATTGYRPVGRHGGVGDVRAG